jgi:hypothetical protein
MEPRYEIIQIKKHSDLYLCQIAVSGVPCTPFWSTAMQRAELGEEAWIRSLCENAESLVRSSGRASEILH